LFIDLVAYSKESTTGQYKIKAALITHLNAVLAPLPASSFRIRDTGDGAVVAFLNNPQHPLYAALALWQACTAGDEAAPLPFKRLRLGLHTGVVKEVPDVEGRANYVGDGINSAKRVQDLANPGQMLASRNFFDAMSHLDADYLRLFEPAGAGDDKHGRSHELYAVHFEQAAFDKLVQEAQQELAHSAWADSAAKSTLPKLKSVPKSASLAIKPIALLASLLLLGVLTLFWFLSKPSGPPAEVLILQRVTPAATTSAAAAPAASAPTTSRDSVPSASNAASVASPATPDTPAVAAVSQSLSPAAAPALPAKAAQSAAVRVPAAAPVIVKAQPIPALKEPVVQVRPKVSDFSVRCSRLLEKVSAGEPLSSSEQQEMVSKCQ